MGRLQVTDRFRSISGEDGWVFSRSFSSLLLHVRELTGAPLLCQSCSPPCKAPSAQELPSSPLPVLLPRFPKAPSGLRVEDTKRRVET